MQPNRSLSRRYGCICVLLFVLPASAEQTSLDNVEARISCLDRVVPVGQPVFVDFQITNIGDQPVTLRVPDTQMQEEQNLSMGLPLAHVFSGTDRSALVVTDDSGRTWNAMTSHSPPTSAPAVTIAPQCGVTQRLNVTYYYDALRRPGKYHLQWRPFEGHVESNVLTIHIETLKQAVIETDYGPLTIQLYYNQAYKTVANFIELTTDGFYDGLTFHMIYSGYLIQGGCPRSDGTGIRPDGKMLELEPSELTHRRGTVSMARKRSAPGSGSCQFFICNTRIPEYDGQYTVFGHLIGERSFETLGNLMSIPVNDDGTPQKPVYIRGVRLENQPVQTR